MQSSFSWTSLSKTPTSNTLCFGEPTLGKLNQETEFCITIHITLGDYVVHTGTKPSLCQELPLKQAEFPTDTPA